MTSREPPPVERFRPAELEQDWGTLRATCPVSRTTAADGTDVWLVSRHRDVRTVLGNQVFCVSPIDVDHGTVEANESIFQDPPEHTRLRGMVSAPFAVGRIGGYRESIRSTADALIAAMAERDGPLDVMADFAKPLTMNVICEVVGVPPQDRAMFQLLSDQLLVPLTEAHGRVAQAGWRRLNDYVLGLVADRKAAGDGDTDLLGHMLQVQDTDTTLTDVELVTMVLGLPVAGYVSTTNAIAVAMRYLLADGWLGRLRAADVPPDLAHRFVEEVLRVQSGDNGESMPRFASADVELGDVTIRRGDQVVAPLVAANRDDELFERPDEFDPLRPHLTRHLAFGFGIHRCLGANLARLELQIAVDAIVASGLDLAMLEDWDEVPWKVNMLGDRFPERMRVAIVAGRTADAAAGTRGAGSTS